MNREKILETLMVMAAGFLAFGLFFREKPWGIWLIVAAFGLLVIAITSTWLAGKVAWAWMKLAETLGKINGGILLSIIFFLFLFPIALLQRLFTGDKLNLKRKEGSYFTERNTTYKSKDLENPW